MNINSYTDTEMIMEALNTFFCSQPQLLNTVELWSLELACLEHQGSLKLVCRSWQFPYTFNVKIHPRLEQRSLELKARSVWRFFM